MSRGPEKYRPINRSNSEARNRRFNNQRKAILAAISALIVLVLVFTTLLISLSISSARRKNDIKNPETSGETESITNSPENSETEKETNPETAGPTGNFVYKNVDFSESAMHLGPLIIVNDQYAYTFSDPTGNIDFRGLRVKGPNSDFPLMGMSMWSMSLRQEAIDALNAFIYDFYKDYSDDQYITIYAAYRNYEDQEKSYNASPSDSPMPGHSDYHTGYAFDFTASSTTSIATVAKDLFSRFNAEQAINAHKYGLINRYPADKTEITGNYKNHYRYVGIPHAYIMNEMNYCLEQYIEYVRLHTIDKEHLTCEVPGGGSYDIYYVPASEGVVTSVPVPEGYEYTVSGDNVSGFIVTVKTK